jgi:hypothetical protein
MIISYYDLPSCCVGRQMRQGQSLKLGREGNECYSSLMLLKHLDNFPRAYLRS